VCVCACVVVVVGQYLIKSNNPSFGYIFTKRFRVRKPVV
jgi:hypothetical protein